MNGQTNSIGNGHHGVSLFITPIKAIIYQPLIMPIVLLGPFVVDGFQELAHYLQETSPLPHSLASQT